MKNKLIVIGYLGCKECYLNIPMEEAIRRYIDEGNEEPDEYHIDEYEFDDQFGAYEIHGYYKSQTKDS